MSDCEVSQLPDTYARAAIRAKDVGFTGVQIHAGHGFLLSQFLSPLFNHRQDQYGGSIQARCRIIVEIIDKVRGAVGYSFPIGIKINSTDQLEGGLTEEDALEAIRLLDQTSVDLIEVSGGSYFPATKSSSARASRGPYFVEFAKEAKSLTKIPVVVTGGFKNREQALNLLESSTVDFVGMARALVLNPDLTNDWITGTGDELNFPRFEAPPEGDVTAWYTMLLTAIGNNSDFVLELSSAIRLYKERDETRCAKWQRKFPH